MPIERADNWQPTLPAFSQAVGCPKLGKSFRFDEHSHFFGMNELTSDVRVNDVINERLVCLDEVLSRDLVSRQVERSV